MKSINPKLQFLRTPESAQFAEAINNPVVRQAIEVALQEFVINQLRVERADDAIKAHYELQGAKNYVSTLLNLTEVEQPHKPDVSGTLQWQPKQKSQTQPKNPPPAQPKPPRT